MGVFEISDIIISVTLILNAAALISSKVSTHNSRSNSNTLSEYNKNSIDELDDHNDNTNNNHNDTLIPSDLESSKPLLNSSNTNDSNNDNNGDKSNSNSNPENEFAFVIKFREMLLNIQAEVEHLIFSLNSYLHDMDSNDFNLPEIQKRLFFLKNLERTFSLDLSQLIEKRDQLKKYFQKNDHDNEINHIQAQIKNLESNLNSLFGIQSTERKKIAKRLQHSVISILNNLGLENANFLIQFSESKPSCDGIDDINFLFSANPDQKLAPLSSVISGGEMSRFLLAIKSSISKKPNTFFFDEIDNGLSGKSLFSLFKLIKEISNDQQVLCITHQPYLAAGGLSHFKVNKNVIDGLTYTSISKLITQKQRKNELIELIGGGYDQANDYASKLLERAAA